MNRPKGFLRRADDRSFDFCHAMRRLCEDIAGRMPEFAHIRMDEVTVAFAQTRRRVTHGLQARLTPMRFEAGSLVTVRNGRRWTVQRLFEGEREMLYILTFYLPRFCEHPFREKLVTVFHELYHIGPRFDGDIRRMDGRYHVHSHSQKDYDREMDALAGRYLARGAPRSLYGFLEHRFDELRRRYGPVVGLQVPIPKLIPIADSRIA